MPTRLSTEEPPSVAPPPPNYQPQQSRMSPQWQNYAPPPPVTPPIQQQQSYSPYFIPPPSAVSAPPNAQQKRTVRLWLILGILGGTLMLCLIVSLVSYAISSQSSPTRTLTTYCNALKIADFATAYSQFSTTYQTNISESTFNNNHHGVSNCNVFTSNEICYRFTNNTTEIYAYSFDSSEKILTEIATGNTC
jgi:hypothetical protein